jgi:hypothetical protein
MSFTFVDELNIIIEYIADFTVSTIVSQLFETVSDVGVVDEVAHEVVVVSHEAVVVDAAVVSEALVQLQLVDDQVFEVD